MHPAYSVIVFTTASGAGYGLLIWLSLFGGLGIIEADQWLGFIGFGLALGLITLGLLSSTFHLGRPERAWRALSQWRTSWLSREGIAALVTYIPAGLLAIAWILYPTDREIWSSLAPLTAITALVTVYCTGQIYASLRTIRQWHLPIVPYIYIVLALTTGALFFNVLLHLFGLSIDGFTWLIMFFLAVSALLKLVYWRIIDTANKTYTTGTATGLGKLGTVHPLDPAHSQPNFVMREMGYEIGRKHGGNLRRLVILFGFLLPIAFTLLTLTPITAAKFTGSLLAVLSATVGIIIERWLFFAEAQHVVTLYYGAERA